MALVSYDYGSESDNDVTDEEDIGNTRIIIKQQNGVLQTIQKPTDNSKTEGGLFSHLPETKPRLPQVTMEEDQLEDFIPTVKTLKEKKKVQITIPSLSEFDDLANEEPNPKRLKQSQQGSGLLAILPAVHSVPKDNTMFIPNSLKKKNVPSKPKPPSASKALIPRSIKNSTKTSKSKAGDDSDTDNEDIPIPDTFDDQMWEKVCGRAKPPVPIVEVDMREQEEPEEITSAPEAQQPYEGLNNEAFKELIGKSKRPIGNIKLIDINEEEILPDRDLWMTKSLTDPDLAPKPEPEDPVDPTKKRKHHITYLAQQAKANEQELKATWATGRNNRIMSRAKYGF